MVRRQGVQAARKSRGVKHSGASRERMARLMVQDHVGAVRHSRDTQKNTMNERGRSQDAVPILKRRPVISHYHNPRQAVVQTEQTAVCNTGRKAMVVCTSKTQT